MHLNVMIATGNKQKLEEITTILQADKTIEWQFTSLPKLPEPDEPYSSFIENACHKAKYYGEQLQLPTLSEDTGICVTALEQFPGVRTKNFVEEHGTIDKAREVLKQKLQNTSDNTATYVCAAALYIPVLNIMLSYEAKEHGYLTFPARGMNGVGFDPVFIPHGQHHTIAELGRNFKNQHSHRAMAIKGLLQQLRSAF